MIFHYYLLYILLSVLYLINPDILSEARKYKLNLIIAHQYVEQMSEAVRAAVFGNVGTMIHAIELRPGGGAKIGRSAGSAVQLVAKDGPYAQLRMPSGEIRNVDVRCRATVGTVGNAEQSNRNYGKAGRMRWKGKRPSVRGVVMNPVDHPHGGGEGKTSGGRHPVSPWGLPEKRTRKKKASDSLIIRRRKSNKKR